LRRGKALLWASAFSVSRWNFALRELAGVRALLLAILLAIAGQLTHSSSFSQWFCGDGRAT
jgi:hypothetical protein